MQIVHSIVVCVIGLAIGLIVWKSGTSGFLGILIGCGVVFLIGDGKAILYEAEAQKLLCLTEIEKNTRKE